MSFSQKRTGAHILSQKEFSERRKTHTERIYVLSSVTFAKKAKDLLSEHGIESESIRTPSVRKVRGCGYGLKVSQRDAKEVEELLELAKIKVYGVV